MGAGPRRGERDGAEAPRETGRLGPTGSGWRGSGRLQARPTPGRLWAPREACGKHACSGGEARELF